MNSTGIIWNSVGIYTRDMMNIYTCFKKRNIFCVCGARLVHFGKHDIYIVVKNVFGTL